MLWYDRYFFHIFYGTIITIIGLSSVQTVKNIKQSKKQQVIEQKQYKDSL